MKIQAHDAHYSLDYAGWVNAVFDACFKSGKDFKFTAYKWGIAPSVMAKFFRYQHVSLPTMLQIEFGSGVKMIDYCVKID